LARLGVARAPVPAGTLGILGAPAPAPPMPTPTPTPAPTQTQTPGIGLAPSSAAANIAAAVLPAVGAPPVIDAVRSPVVARIARLLDPPTASWSLRAAVYVAAVAVFATPPALLLL
nr:hypothetical protein [Micromonospora sp. DSM 115978]